MALRGFPCPHLPTTPNVFLLDVCLGQLPSLVASTGPAYGQVYASLLALSVVSVGALGLIYVFKARRNKNYDSTW